MSPARAGARLDAPVHLVRGEDPVLVAQAARTLVEQLAGSLEHSLVVEEHGVGDDLDVAAVVDACTTPPFLVDRRIVVVRDAGRIGTAEASRLVAVLEHPLASVHLVLVSGGGTIPTSLVKAASAVGGVVETSVGRGRERGRWMADQLRHAPVKLDAGAVRRLEEHLGEDLGRLEGLLQSLAAAYGEGARVSPAVLEPFLGEAGAVPPWELTDAIDSGDVTGALRALRRLLAAGRASPMVVAILHGHFSAMLRLDGADVVSDDAAAALLGARSAYVAKKALDGARRLGSERIGHAVTLLADADLDVKGRTALPPEMVLEILVARLARLVRGRGGMPPSAHGRAGPRVTRARR